MASHRPSAVEINKFIQENSTENASLRPHQLDAVDFMLAREAAGNGCIVADEMGLGKTCQTVAALVALKKMQKNFKFLTICPLSVFDHWEKEIKKFSCGLDCRGYRGEKEEREKMMERIKEEKASWDGILTTYELFLKDVAFFIQFSWNVLVVDEAHRLKNSNSQIFKAVNTLNSNWKLLLTGTPVQNNMDELFSLLHLVAPSKFRESDRQNFIQKHKAENRADMEKLRKDLKQFVLRRTKTEVCLDIPSKSEVVLYHGLTDMQKGLYKAILAKNHQIFENAEGNRQSLMNTLVQLRKCVDHPYLFDGVEPEPFAEGEHLVEASGKLRTLDALLQFLRHNGHKVLLFSQMTRLLDILQDYLTFRGWSYERLDGSVRGEERFAAVERFNRTEETFAFLLSTRAGGVGLTLTAADTVVFLDSDFNPQNDIQAAARAHRIGQDRPVKIVRLIGRDTVEEIILSRAAQKLKLTAAVMTSENDKENEPEKMTAAEIAEFLTYGLRRLNDSTADSAKDTDESLKGVLGPSKDGKWEEEPKKEMPSSVATVDLESTVDDIYTFEGKDYKEEAKKADKEALAELIQSAAKDQQPRAKIPQLALPQKRRELTEEEKEARKVKRLETERKKKEAEVDRERRHKEQRDAKRQALWERNSYQSCNLPEWEEEEEMEEETEEEMEPIFVRGNVASPKLRQEHCFGDAVVVHCVDNSGQWGSGGVFGALASRSPQPVRVYELAGKMEDLNFGDAHLVQIDDVSSRSEAADFAALLVAQDRRQRDSIRLEGLSAGLKRIGKYAKDHKGTTVHLPRIGYGMVGVNWYAIERLIRKYLVSRGIPTYIYYFQRTRKRQHSPQTNGEASGAKAGLSSVFEGARILVRGGSEEEKKKVERLIVAFDGEVAGSLDDSPTHLVLLEPSNNLELEIEKADEEGVKIVEKRWFDDCLKEKKLLPV